MCGLGLGGTRTLKEFVFSRFPVFDCQVRTVVCPDSSKSEKDQTEDMKISSNGSGNDKRKGRVGDLYPSGISESKGLETVRGRWECGDPSGRSRRQHLQCIHGYRRNKDSVRVWKGDST